ncbi:MAG: hypothetical protein AMJ75_00235 [Phycisphaerae bacterium SM1_79]|nr:MAG: hypothetical protein AMJ75_00235 [Phycisphaerae bacterium SM1_79]
MSENNFASRLKDPRFLIVVIIMCATGLVGYTNLRNDVNHVRQKFNNHENECLPVIDRLRFDVPLIRRDVADVKTDISEMKHNLEKCQLEIKGQTELIMKMLSDPNGR